MLYDPNWKAPEVKLEPWQQLLLKAADLIEEKGWVKHSFYIPDKGYCAMGALRQLTGLVCEEYIATEFLVDDYHKAARKLGAILPITCSIAAWNDYVATKKEQVIAKLREAAAPCYLNSGPLTHVTNE